MTVVVQKFGGSSLADLDRLGQVAELVAHARRPGESLVVVVSAMGKTTEQLLELGRNAAALSEPPAGFQAPRRELDLLVSSGERISMALLAIALAARGVDAVSLTGSQAGVITTDQHFDANVLEVRPARIRQALERGRVVIVAGYQGMSEGREVTTLGRGGSDTTAVALAGALGAKRCEIYSDVDGVYTADPHRVREARHLPWVDYDTVLTMAEAGARVLCARALEWGARHDVAIHARATRDFTGARSGRETRVVSAVNGAAPRAVVVNRALALVRVPRALLSATRAGLERSGLRVRDLELRDEHALLTLPLTGVPDYPAARRALEREGIAGLSIDDDCGELSVVGPGVEHDERLAFCFESAEVRLSLRRPARRSVVMREAGLADAERAWHARVLAAA